ncbi:hypothetical protein CJ030_MR7G016908 [Morella rubra]|uniref:DUF4216 domain-containing protein n=1 Tax=Morella rubra TaxID=262757 RepID=A0A6A1V1L6_9ROSI|nr:hypothetical protein CJ030_MR7G016906 [Morella rubra]KAB1205928.1 hypothetical protein CJ030_MR7G016908 [Morella rubra]
MESSCSLPPSFFEVLLEITTETQNSSVVVPGDHNGVAVEFYCVVVDILAVHYLRKNLVYVFKCDWRYLSNIARSIMVNEHTTSFITDYHLYINDSFVLVDQGQQVFYLADPK